MEAHTRIDFAFYREKQIQRWSHSKKEALIRSDTNELHQLAACRNETHSKNKTESRPDFLSLPLSMSKTAIILGATGLTGSLVLEQLIANDAYAEIKLFSRSSSGIDHPKVKEFLGNVLQLDTFSADFTGDEVYVCIGTTKKKTPNRELYRRIDFGIPVTAAALAKKNGIPAIAVISALGANSKSWIEYNRIKGDMEQAVFDKNVERTYILRPSIISGDRNEKRGGENFGINVFKFLRPILVGPLKKYRAVEARDIAKKMIALCNSQEPSRIVESDGI